MSEQDNVRLVQEAYAAFGRGDLPALLELLSEDVEWLHPRPEAIPWGGHRRGREEVSRFFAALAATVEVEEFEVKDFIAQGDRVIVTGRERMRVKANGRTYETDWIHDFTTRGGFIAGFREYTDTAAIEAAFNSS